MKATIITIGDEILIGQIVDTNSVSIAKHLNAAGIVVHEKVSIGDDSTQIVRSVERALGDSNVVVITGGLGPTKDDITKKTLAGMFGCELVPDQRVADHVKRMLEGRGIEFNELNRGQAMVPACCTVLFNAHGTAPGMWFERDGHVAVSLPGVPFEMEHLMEDEVMPRLKARFALRQIVHRTMITAGLPESMLAKRIEAWENALPPYLKLAYLPNPGAVRLRLSAYEVEGESVAREIERIERRRQRREERKAQRGEAQAAGAAPAEAPKPREVEAGSKVRMAGQDMVGVVQSVKGRKAQVAFGQILTTVDRKMLTVVSNSEFREATRPQTARTVVSADISARKLSFKDHIDVRGMRAAEALDAVQDFIDDALMVGVGSVSILHGKGTGALKEEIRRYLRTVPEVESARDEHADRGGAGITIVTFDLS